jgi:hypothetical protein
MMAVVVSNFSSRAAESRQLRLTLDMACSAAGGCTYADLPAVIRQLQMALQEIVGMTDVSLDCARQRAIVALDGRVTA